MKSAQRNSAWAWLAILAVICQLGLSLGHMHGQLGGAFDRLAAVTDDGWPAAPAPAGPANPFNHDNGCLVCWAAAMAGAGLIAEPPALLVPAEHLLRHPSARSATWRLVARAAPFNARAPPADPLI